MSTGVSYEGKVIACAQLRIYNFKALFRNTPLAFRDVVNKKDRFFWTTSLLFCIKNLEVVSIIMKKSRTRDNNIDGNLLMYFK